MFVLLYEPFIIAIVMFYFGLFGGVGVFRWAKAKNISLSESQFWYFFCAATLLCGVATFFLWLIPFEIVRENLQSWGSSGGTGGGGSICTGGLDSLVGGAFFILGVWIPIIFLFLFFLLFYPLLILYWLSPIVGFAVQRLFFPYLRTAPGAESVASSEEDYWEYVAKQTFDTLCTSQPLDVSTVDLGAGAQGESEIDGEEGPSEEKSCSLFSTAAVIGGFLFLLFSLLAFLVI